MIESSNQPKDFDIDKYLATGAFSIALSGDKKIKLKAIFDKFAAAHLYESPLSVNQTIEEKEDGNVLIEADVLDTQQLRWWILSFGGHVEVVSPNSLREEISKTVNEMASRYKDF